MSLSKYFETASFKLLSEGMRDQQAMQIVNLLYQKPTIFADFERWAKDELNERNLRGGDVPQAAPKDEASHTSDRMRYGLKRESPWAKDLLEPTSTIHGTPPVVVLIKKLQEASQNLYYRDCADLLDEAAKALTTLFTLKVPDAASEWRARMTEEARDAAGRNLFPPYMQTSDSGKHQTFLYTLGQRVKKPKGSWWEGKVVGFYSTEQTPIGYCVQLSILGVTIPAAPVQIYPQEALVAVR